MNLRVTMAVALVPLFFAACRSPVATSDFTRECASDDECVVVQVGDTCEPNRCEAGAIHVDELARYRASQGGLCWQTVVSVALTTCGSTLPEPVACVDEASAACIDGACVAQPLEDA